MLVIVSVGGGVYFDVLDVVLFEVVIDDVVGVMVCKQEWVIEKCINDVWGGEIVVDVILFGLGFYIVGELLFKQIE